MTTLHNCIVVATIILYNLYITTATVVCELFRKFWIIVILRDALPIHNLPMKMQHLYNQTQQCNSNWSFLQKWYNIHQWCISDHYWILKFDAPLLYTFCITLAKVIRYKCINVAFGLHKCCIFMDKWKMSNVQLRIKIVPS